MTEQASIVQEGIDRFRDAFGNLEDELERVQKQIRTRRRRFEKQLDANRSAIEKRISSGRKDLEKRTRKLREDVRKNRAFQRLDSLRKDATRRYEEGVESLLGLLQIASKGDVQRIDRKISQLSRKLKDMEHQKKANGQAVSA
jgi:hypothetical protein